LQTMQVRLSKSSETDVVVQQHSYRDVTINVRTISADIKCHYPKIGN